MAPPLHIALVSRELAPYFGAGIGTYIASAARSWADAGHRVTILTEAHPGVVEGPQREQPAITIRVARDDEGVAASRGLRFHHVRRALAVHQTLSLLHDADPFDVIELPDYGAEGRFVLEARRSLGAYAGALLAVRLHAPTAECRAINGETSLDDEQMHLMVAEDRALRDADAWIGLSTSLTEMVRARLGTLRRDLEIIRVAYPFDVARASELGDARAASSEPPGLPTILCFGRLEARKGVDVLVRAAVRMLDAGTRARFLLVGADTSTAPGGGSMRAHLESLVPPQHKQSIRIEPARPRGTLGPLIRGASVVAFPARWDNFPSAVLEAMSLGACVVASDVGGLSEMITHERSGLLVPPGDDAALAAALTRALSDGSLRERLASAAAGAVTERCDPARAVREIVALRDRLRTVAAAPSGNAPPPMIPVEIDADAPGDLLERLRRSGATWALVRRSGATINSRLLSLAAAIAAREPEVALITAFTREARGGIVRAWPGLERDLLGVYHAANTGALLIRVDALPATWGSCAGLAAQAPVWTLSAMLAQSGVPSRVIPEPLIDLETPPTGPADPARFARTLRDVLPALAHDPARVSQWLASRDALAAKRLADLRASRAWRVLGRLAPGARSPESPAQTLERVESSAVYAWLARAKGMLRRP